MKIILGKKIEANMKNTFGKEGLLSCTYYNPKKIEKIEAKSFYGLKIKEFQS